ncbi:hypothetical protein [Streptomyces sp. NPDC091027]|uniref:hypothetical protein n=1 Tax=Streptomyces sp. NPDC091027 TaxID=3365971 RepID=UPI00381A9B50
MHGEEALYVRRVPRPDQAGARGAGGAQRPEAPVRPPGGVRLVGETRHHAR